MMNESKYIDGLVSVVMPTYKRSDMLIRAVKSVLAQTYEKIELLVVNDNDPDDAYSKLLGNRLEVIHDSRLKLVNQEKHINGAVARNVGIKEARGEYIAFLDDDDTWNKYKIEHQVNTLKKLDPSWGAVSCLKLCYLNGELKRASLPYKDGYIFEDVLDFMTNITTGTILMRRSALDESGYFDENLLRQQDVQLFAFFANKYKIKLLKEYLLNMDISDAQNRPNIERYMDVKNKYLESVNTLIDQLPPHKKKQLRLHIRAGYGIQLIKAGKRVPGVKAFMSTLISPTVFLKEVGKYLTLAQEATKKDRNIREYGGDYLELAEETALQN